MMSYPLIRRVKPALGTLVTLAVEGIDSATALAATEDAFRELYRLEKLFNRFDDESELSRWRRGERTLPSPELAELLAEAARVEAVSDGAFRVRDEGGQLDLGGIAKGYIVDCLYRRLRASAPRVTVNAGGDLRSNRERRIEIRAGGDRRYDLPWDVGAVATSVDGGTRVGEPRARYRQPARYGAVAVAADRCLIADAFTKVALFGDWRAAWNRLPGLRAIYLFDDEGRVCR